jgi:S-adenosylmethionine synthetase
MNTFAIVATSFEKIGNNVHLQVILESLTEKEILAIKAEMLLYQETINTSHPTSGDLKVEGIALPVSREIFFNLLCEEYNIIPMWTINNFK